MIETDLFLSYFISSLLGFRQFAGRFGDQGSRSSKKVCVIQKYFQVFFLVERIMEALPCPAFLRHFWEFSTHSRKI